MTYHYALHPNRSGGSTNLYPKWDPNWLSESIIKNGYQTPTQALEHGRIEHGNNVVIFVLQLEVPGFADFLPDMRIMLAEMKEKAVDLTGDRGEDSFNNLTSADITEFEQRLWLAVRNWETEQRAFNGVRVTDTRGYLPGAVASDFSRPPLSSGGL